MMAARKGLNFEDIGIGLDLPTLKKGPLNTTHLMRWSAATENWHRIHYDRTFAVEHDRLPDVLIHGSLKQQFLFQFLRDWVGRTGWVWKVRYQFRAMDKVGQELFIWGKVTGLKRAPDFGLVDLEIGIRNGDGAESTPGTAVVALPYREGQPIPYPFVVPTTFS